MRAAKASCLLVCVISLLTAVESAAQQGTVYFGNEAASDFHGIHPLIQQPLSGAHVYLFAIGSGGPNTAPYSLLDPSGSGVNIDPAGNAYVTTNSSGNFNISGLYASRCPSGSTRVYLQSLGGNPGAGNNTAIAMNSVMLATCPNLPYVTGVYVDERTNAAAAFGLTAFANTSATPIDGFSTDTGSGTALGNSITYANNLISGYSGAAGTYAPVAMVNTISDVIGSCVNSAGPSSPNCSYLFSYTNTSYITPADTWQANLSMAQSPTNNVANEYYLIPPVAAFQPTLTSPPSAWLITPNTTPLPGAVSPSIASLSVSSGYVGDSVTITGTNFVSSDSVVIGGVHAVVTGNTSTSITVTVPTGAITGFLQVYGSGFGSNAVPFTVM